MKFAKLNLSTFARLITIAFPAFNSIIMRRLFYLLVVVISLSVPYGCNQNGTEPITEPYLKYKTSDYNAAIAHEWMQLGYQMIKDNFLFGPHAARTYGYLGLTVYEAVHRGIPSAKSLAGQINDYPEAAYFDEGKSYDWGVVMCAAMETVYPALMDNMSSAQRSTVQLLAEQQEAQMMNKGLTQEIFENSRDYGTRVGLKIVERIRKDGRDVIRNIVPQLPARDAAHPWYWDRSTFNQNPVEPMWGTVRTFVTDNSQSCEGEAPYAYSVDPNSPFYKDAKEVFDVARTPENKALAYHFDNGPGRTCSPACHWVSITEQLLKEENRDLAFAAKAYCLVGFAAADAFSAAWYMKYKYNLMRPATYLKEQFDPNYEALLGTPPYPDYTSGSSAIGGAAPTVLIPLFGDRAFVDRTHVGSPLYTPDGGPFILPERAFSSITDCGLQQAESRIVGGVHFRRACSESLKMGRCVGGTIMNRLDFGF